MVVNTLRTFFLWCTIINGAMLLITPLIYIFALDWVYSIHNRLFNVPKETFKTMGYSFIFLYKLLWMIFNFVPWLALLIVT